MLIGAPPYIGSYRLTHRSQDGSSLLYHYAHPGRRPFQDWIMVREGRIRNWKRKGVDALRNRHHAPLPPPGGGRWRKVRGGMA